MSQRPPTWDDIETAEERAHELANRLTAIGLWADVVLDYLREDEAELRRSGCADAADELAALIADGAAALAGRSA